MMIVGPQQLKKLKGIGGIRDFSMVVEEKGMMQNGENQSMVYLRGVDENYRYVTGVADNLVNGQYELVTKRIPQTSDWRGSGRRPGHPGRPQIFPLNIYLPRKSNTEQLDILEDISNDTIRTSAAFRIQQDFDNKFAHHQY